MKYPRNLKILRNRVDGTAFSSVLLLVILFILLESSLVFKPGISIRLPSPNSTEFPGITGPTLVVGIDHNNQFFFDGKTISSEHLLEQLIRARKNHTDTSIIIVADKDSNTDTLVQLSSLTYRAGLKNVLIATNPDTTTPTTHIGTTPANAP